MKLEYTKDICGNDILQDETGVYQVMMEWENHTWKNASSTSIHRVQY